MSPALSRLSSDDAVKLLLLRAFEIIRSHDFDRYFDLFSDDAVWMMPSNAKDVHIEEARSFYGFTKKFWFDQETRVEELSVHDDWGYARISFDGYLRSKFDESAPPLRSVSRHVWILRREPGGDWKITRDIWNTPRN